ncbi:MAG: ankyrin repeat domain-containing protein [Gammaproteobacteria bacterium]|nr:ankyrin repeat domain-containing protein [Gammaproteobacteria bacterium]
MRAHDECARDGGNAAFAIPFRAAALAIPALLLAMPVSAASGNKLLDGDFWATATPGEVRALLDGGADLQAVDELQGATPLHHAAFHSPAPEVVALLLERGADIEARAAYGSTPLHFAAGFNKEPGVTALLLERGANIEARGDDSGATPLYLAAGLNESPAVVALLLERGANVEARDNIGTTPLHHAAERRETPAVVKLLLDRGADVNARSPSGYTPLHLAAIGNAPFLGNAPGNAPAVVALLLDRGAELEARTQRHGATPLWLAAESRSLRAPDIVVLLLDRGANPGAKSKSGETPLDRAEENELLRGSEALRRLREASATRGE